AHAVIFKQELLVDRHVDMIPGEDFVIVTHPVGVEPGVEIGFGKGLQPAVMMVVILPGVEFAAKFPGTFDHPAQPAIPPAEKALKFAALDIVPAQVQAIPPDFAFEELLLLKYMLRGVLRNPLERRVWFGNKGADPDI